MTKNIITISAPSGSGKTTLCKALLTSNKSIKLSVSYTTRSPRDNESNGSDYFFISENIFKKKIKNREFAEWEKVYGYFYGTLKKTLIDAIKLNKQYLFELDVLGALEIKKQHPKHTLSIFILPPSIEVVKKRLIDRGANTNKQIETRLARFSKELNFKNKFDKTIFNEDLDNAKEELIKTVNDLTKLGVKKWH